MGQVGQPEHLDHALWSTWTRGGEEGERAGDRLVRRYLLSIYRFFDTKVPGFAEDLTQRTFLACVRGRTRFRRDSSFRVFLFGIARIELLRHLEGRGAGLDTATMSSSALAAGDPSPSTAVAELQERDALLAALRGLPMDFQMVLELHYWEDFSVDEIADVLEVSPGTVKSRLHRGREKLRRAFGRAHGEVFRGSHDQLEHVTRRLGRRLLGETR